MQEHLPPVTRRKGATLWFTGLSGSGKTTLAIALEAALTARGVASYRLDGDVLRQGLNRGLGFSAADRSENIRRTAEVARLFADAGLLALVSFISPYAADRQRARELHAASGLAFFEVHVDCPLPEAERRDPKGLYRKARAGEIKGFTGIDDPYEAPQAPELRLPTHELSIDETVEKVLSLIEARGIIAPA